MKCKIRDEALTYDRCFVKQYPRSPTAATGKSRELGHKTTFRAQFGKMVKNEITFTYL